MPSPAETLPDGFRGTVQIDPASLDRVSRDRSHLSQRPSAVVAPADRDDVVTLVRWARGARVPLVPRGGGTSLDGGSVPPPGSVVVDLSGWNRILEVDSQEQFARVEPGVVNFALHEELAGVGQFFPPNPGSWTECTIGGNVATNASGPRSFRYGATRRWVRTITVVTGAGETVTVGTMARKRSTGPELLDLLIGSEGTLGIFTEITVGLAPRPARRSAWVVPLPPTVDLPRLAATLAHATDLGLSAVEYLDGLLSRALAERLGLSSPGRGALGLLEVESPDADEETRRLERLDATLRSLGVVEAPRVFPDSDRMWTVRGEAGVALDREFGPRIREDVAVPLGRLGDLLDAIGALARRYGVESASFAHLGEASVHPNFAVDPTSPAAQRLRADLLTEVHRLGGTISAEHGIGRLKRSYRSIEHGPVELALLEGVRRVFDPDGILNPGALSP